MDNKLRDKLQELGLSDHESRVYDALLELGQSVVTPIATLVKINRTSCYNVLESLVQKKMVRKSRTRGKFTYSIDDPNQLIRNLEEESKAIEDRLEKARSIQADIAKRYSEQHSKPIVTYVQGLDGIKKLYDDSLRCQNKVEGIRSYTSIRDLSQELGEYADWYFAERARRGIPIRGIVPDTEYGKQNKRVQEAFLRQVRLIPKDKFDFSPEIYLYDNKFSVMSPKEKFGFMLESREIVDALKAAWQLAWERAGEYDKDIKI